MMFVFVTFDSSFHWSRLLFGIAEHFGLGLINFGGAIRTRAGGYRKRYRDKYIVCKCHIVT